MYNEEFRFSVIATRQVANSGIHNIPESTPTLMDFDQHHSYIQSTRTRQKCGCVMSKRNLPEVIHAARAYVRGMLITHVGM